MENDIELMCTGALGEIRLTRARALNALNDAMRAEIIAKLPDWARDAEIYALAVTSSSPRAFCAGGDVRELAALAQTDPTSAATSLATEYTMNWSLECFTKPTVSLINGMVMGSGAGLVLYGTHRVAGEQFRFSMPETAIGLFPDVGVASHLSKMPNNIGRYLGLTGRQIGRTTALRLGLLTHCIDSQNYAAILEGLADADPVDPILDRLHQTSIDDAEPDEGGDVFANAGLIEETFGGATVLEIRDNLVKRQAGGSSTVAEWCAGVLKDLADRAPLSLVVTLRHLDACRELDLRDVLIRDYRLAVRFMADKDFREGVRALIIDKDKSPVWHPASLEEIDDTVVQNYSAPLAKDELPLQTRDEMQNFLR